MGFPALRNNSAKTKAISFDRSTRDFSGKPRTVPASRFYEIPRPLLGANRALVNGDAHPLCSVRMPRLTMALYNHEHTSAGRTNGVDTLGKKSPDMRAGSCT